MYDRDGHSAAVIYLENGQCQLLQRASSLAIAGDPPRFLTTTALAENALAVFNNALQCGRRIGLQRVSGAGRRMRANRLHLQLWVVFLEE
jgi:hypothetical protein